MAKVNGKAQQEEPEVIPQPESEPESAGQGLTSNLISVPLDEFNALMAAAKVVVKLAHKHTYGSAIYEVPVEAVDALKKALE
jgi:hypothetical protein